MSSTVAMAQPVATIDPPQHMKALERANHVRTARAELKRAIGRGEVTVAQVVNDLPWEMESITLIELLTSQRRWGRTRARKFLLPLSLPEGKQLGSLTARQRKLLKNELTAKASSAAA